jgi:hypothetical protein
MYREPRAALTPPLQPAEPPERQEKPSGISRATQNGAVGIREEEVWRESCPGGRLHEGIIVYLILIGK